MTQETQSLPSEDLPDLETSTPAPVSDLDGEPVVPEGVVPEGIGPSLFRFALPSMAALGSIGALEYLRYRFQRSHMFEPSRYPEGDWQPGQSGLEVEDVEFASEDGTRLHGWWIDGPSQPDGTAPMTVVYCHGNKGCIAERVEIFKRLRRLDINIFAFDYRGFGRSEGEPSENGVYADVRAAVDYVNRDRAVPFEQIILFGHSLGGAIAIDGALNRPQIAGLVVQSSFTQNLDMARHFYPDLPVHWITRNGFRSIEKVRHLPMPKLFIHGDADLKVPFSQGRALFEAAAEPKNWLPIANAEHGDVHLKGGLRYFSRWVQFRREARRYGLSRVRSRDSEATGPA